MSKNVNVKPQNLLIIFSDQHSKEKFGAYGNEFIKTPNLDKLCEEGTRFTNAYSNNPICCPARAVVATGDYCHKNGYWENCHAYNGEVESWGHRLNDQGYRVTTVGKLHFKTDTPDTGYVDQRIPLHIRGNVGDLTHCIREGIDRSALTHDTVLTSGAGESSYIDYDKQVTDVSLDIIRNELPKEDKPWCLQIGYVAPHHPWIVPEEILDLYRPFDKLPFPIQWGLDERPMHEGLEFFRNEMGLNNPDITDEDIRRTVACYYAHCTYLDMNVGKIMDALRESGMAENTRILYFTDHGESMGDHRMFFKINMFEGSVAIPMVMAGEGIPKNHVVESAVSQIDIFPTVLDCVGAKPKAEDADLPGTSLFKFMGDDVPEDRPVLSESHAIGVKSAIYMLRYKDYKLNYYVDFTPALYNIKEDPQELRDIANDPECKEVLDMMIAELRKLVDPEEMDRRAKEAQVKLMNAHGGYDAIFSQRMITASPVPKV